MHLQLNKGLGYCFHLNFQSEMNYNPEMESTTLIQILRREDTGFGAGSWGTVAVKSLGLGMMMYTFDPRRERQANPSVQGQPRTESVPSREKLRYKPWIPAFRTRSHTDLWVQGQSTKQVPGQPSLGGEGVEKQKTSENVIEQGGHLPAPASSRPRQLWPCGSDFRVKSRRLDYWDNWWCSLAG